MIKYLNLFSSSLKKLQDIIQHNLLYFLLSMYILAAVVPKPGAFLRDLSLSIGNNPDQKLSLPMMMLAFLLFSSGLNVSREDLKRLPQSAATILVGLCSNIFIPLFLIGAFVFTFRETFPTEAFQALVIALTVIGCMPIAGSSPTWAQNANGNSVVSLGLVVLSTALSPFTSPLGFRLTEFFASHSTGVNYLQDLVHLSTSSTSFFLLTCVVGPTSLGIILKLLIKKDSHILPTIKWIKLISVIDLLVLNYSNASVSLPQAFKLSSPSLVFSFVVVTSLFCFFGFLNGLLMSHIIKADTRERASLVFGLGMNNNGTGLVLVAEKMNQHPLVLLPIILFNLEQQIMAGLMEWWLRRPCPRVPPNH